MSGVNKVILIGRLGRDPEIRYMSSGDAVANVRIATSETWKDKASGERQERTEWHSVVFFGKLAEIVEKYLRKGSQVYVEGKLRTRKWQGQDGADRYSTEIVIDAGGVMQMLDSKAAGGGYSAQAGDGSGYGAKTPQRASQQPSRTPEAAFNDDIPF